MEGSRMAHTHYVAAHDAIVSALFPEAVIPPPPA
jgi:hypothetical protein